MNDAYSFSRQPARPLYATLTPRRRFVAAWRTLLAASASDQLYFAPPSLT